MSRWNLSGIYFYSHDGKRKDIPLETNKVNIIVGDSGTGKSAIIKTIDYCLGSKECDLPIYIRDRCSHVAIKWKLDESEMLVSRPIPNKFNKSSTMLYVSYGKNILVPKDSKDLPGKTNLSDGKNQIESYFGIGDKKRTGKNENEKDSRITIRLLIPYLFLTGNVILNDKMLFEGLDDRRKLNDIIDAAEYFLGIADEESLDIEKKLRQLRYALEIEKRKENSAADEINIQQQEARNLIYEAVQAGMLKPDEEISQDIIYDTLKSLSRWSSGNVQISNETEIDSLYNKQERLSNEITRLSKKVYHSNKISDDANDFSGTVDKQLIKLKTINLFNDTSANTCPVCNSNLIDSADTIDKIRNTIEDLEEQSDVVNRQKPRLSDYINELRDEILSLKKTKSDVEQKISSILAKEEELKERLTKNERAIMVAGRISYHLDNLNKNNLVITKEQSTKTSENIKKLEEKWNPDQRERNIKTTEHFISKNITEALKKLPVVAPLEGADAFFDTKDLSLTVQDDDGRDMSFKSIGSDQNYLAMHIASFFSIHKQFEKKSSPVPGLIVIDQLSRPYFPADDEYKEVRINKESNDPDSRALRKHVDFLFNEIEDQNGLQAILIEHAYISNDKRYTEAVKQRWSVSTNEKLIPQDWPIKK